MLVHCARVNQARLDAEEQQRAKKQAKDEKKKLREQMKSDYRMAMEYNRHGDNPQPRMVSRPDHFIPQGCEYTSSFRQRQLIRDMEPDFTPVAPMPRRDNDHSLLFHPNQDPRADLGNDWLG